MRVPYIPDEESDGSYTISNIIGPGTISWWAVGSVIAGVVLLILILVVVAFKKDKQDKKAKGEKDET